jgi:hypothetical protein
VGSEEGAALCCWGGRSTCIFSAGRSREELLIVVPRVRGGPQERIPTLIKNIFIAQQPACAFKRARHGNRALRARGGEWGFVAPQETKSTLNHVTRGACIGRS